MPARFKRASSTGFEGPTESRFAGMTVHKVSE